MKKRSASKIWIGILLLASLNCRAVEGFSIQVNLPTESVPLSEKPESTSQPSGQRADPGEAGIWQEAVLTPMVGFNNRFHPLGQIGGNSYAAAASERYAYLGAGPRILILDLASEADLRIVGQSAVLPGVVRGAALRHPYLFAAAGKGGLRVLDVSDPTLPVEVGSLEGMQWAMSVLLEGDRLYVADNALGLVIVGISDPAHPELLGMTKLKTPAAALAARGDLVFVVHMSGGLVSIDVSNPQQPQVLSEMALPQMSAGITLVDRYALVAAGNEGLLVIDISDPAGMRQISAVKTPLADGIAQADGRVFLTDFVSGLLVFDLTHPADPRQIGALPLTLFSQQVPGQRQVAAGGGRVLLANPNQGLVVVDVSRSAEPVLLNTLDAPLTGAAFDIVPDGGLAFVTRDFIGIGSVQVTDEGSLDFIASELSFVQGAPVRTSWKFEIRGRYAFITDVNLGFRVVDLGSLEQVGRISEPRSWTNLVIDEAVAYAATTEHDTQDGDPESRRSLRVVDISNPTQPRQIGVLKMENNARAAALQGNFLYYPDFLELQQTAAGGSAALRVIDVSNPSNPLPIGEVDTTGQCSQVSSIVILGSHAYLGDMQNGLCIVDIADPGNPRIVGSWKEMLTIYDMALVGQRIFAACYSHVAALDLSDPLAPRLEDITITPGLSWGIAAEGDRVYVADMDGGFNLLGYR